MPAHLGLFFHSQRPAIRSSPARRVLWGSACGLAYLACTGSVWAGSGRFVLTGAPGAGKTALLKHLAEQGLATVPGTFAALAETAGAEGRLDAFLADAAARQPDLLESQFKAEAGLPRRAPAFLDRGTLDIAFFAERNRHALPEGFLKRASGNSYDLAFLLESGPDGAAIGRELASYYQRNGYRNNLVTVPAGSVPDRGRFIFDTIRERYRFADVIDHFAEHPAGSVSWFAEVRERLPKPFSGPVELMEMHFDDRERPHRFFGVRQELQDQIDYPGYRHSLAERMGARKGPLLELVGDSNRFSASASTWAGHYLAPHFERASIIEYGYTGYSDGAELDVNSFVTRYLEKHPGEADKVLGNIVGHTHVALLKWGTTGSKLVRNFVVVYNRDGMTAAPEFATDGRKTSGYTTFGDDVTVSDRILQASAGDWLICLEGGAQSFLQVLNALEQGVPVELVSGLRKATDLRRFSAARFLLAIRDLFRDKAEPTPSQVRAAFAAYESGLQQLFDPSRPDHLTKKQLFKEALDRFIDGGLYRKLAGKGVTFVQAESVAESMEGAEETKAARGQQEKKDPV